MKSTVEGVFPDVVDIKAFLDKVTVSINGKRRDSPQIELRQRVRRPIGGSGGKYSWIEQAVLASSGNPFDLVYGPMRLGGILPALVLTLRSEGAPLNVDEIENVIDGYCEKGWTASVSLVELTFDLTGLSTEWFRFCVFSSAHRFRTRRDDYGAETHYFGGPTSPLQTKVYEKTKEVTRLEFTLRRPFLRQQGITKLSELEKLRTLDFSRRFWLRELDKEALKTLERSVGDAENARRRALVSVSRCLAHREFIPRAKKYYHAVPGDLLVQSPVEKQLRRMQARLVI
jgi:hypothetical protein